MIDKRITLFDEIIDHYIDVIKPTLWIHAVLLVGILTFWAIISYAQKRKALTKFKLLNNRPFIYGLLGVAILGGVFKVLDHASLFDDAYVSFRYARNFAEGNGLVFNLGEKVEGYTNFLWTVTIGLLIKLTGFEAPPIALVLGVFTYIANLVTVYIIGKQLSSQHGITLHLPLAVVGLALHQTFADYGTSGLETMAASLFVNWGLFWILKEVSIKSAFLSGLMLILATFTRPDHSLFYAVGSAIVLGVSIIRIVSADRDSRFGQFRAGILRCLGYAGPFLLYALYLVWKLKYYGDIFPNTYYAKSADLSYYSQGVLYATLFYLGQHFLSMSLLFIVYLIWPTKQDVTRRFKFFTGLAFVSYNFYILKVGGDFMHGRFYVSLLPLVLLGIEDLIHINAIRGFCRPRNGWVIAICLWGLSMSALSIDMFPKFPRKWGVADESRFYQLTKLYPVTLSHMSARMGKDFRKFLYDRGIRPAISTHGLGMLSYYSRLPVIDQHGLTDATVAHQKIKVRGEPGHEKHASVEYLRKRKVLFSRALAFIPTKFQDVTKIKLGKNRDRGWTIMTYQKSILDRIHKVSKEIHFADFPKYLDGYIAKSKGYSLKMLESDFQFFTDYYFKWNTDTRRHAAIKKIIEQKRQAHKRQP